MMTALKTHSGEETISSDRVGGKRALAFPVPKRNPSQHCNRFPRFLSWITSPFGFLRFLSQTTTPSSFLLAAGSFAAPSRNPRGQARLIEVLIMTLHFPPVPSSPARALLLREVLFRVFQGFVSSSIVIQGRNGFAALQPHHPHPLRLKTALGNTLG